MEKWVSSPSKLHDGNSCLHSAEAIVSDPSDLEDEKAYIKQALCWKGYPAWLLEGADMPPLDQLAEQVMEENSLDPAPLQVGGSNPAETTVVQPPVLDTTRKS